MQLLIPAVVLRFLLTPQQLHVYRVVSYTIASFEAYYRNIAAYLFSQIRITFDYICVSHTNIILKKS